MAISSLHKEALLNLTNLFTVSQYNEKQSSQSEDIPAIRFNENLQSFDLTALPRIAGIILKFENTFLDDSNDDSSRDENQSGALYIEKISVLVEFIEENNWLKKDPVEVIHHHAASQHIQMLISLIRDWLLKFYIERPIIHELFPTVDAEKTSFSLLDIKENNIFLITLLVINIFYQLRQSFPKYLLLLEFSNLYFKDLYPFLTLASLNQEYVSSLLQTSLLSLQKVEDPEPQLSVWFNQQMSALSNRFFETSKKRLVASMDSNKLSSKLSKASDEERSKAIILSQQLAMLNDSTAKETPSSVVKSNPANQNSESERPYKCDQCSKTFPTSYKLNRHSYSHNGDRPYVCTWPNCHKKFNDNYHLRRHVNTHTGEKPYQCAFTNCLKRYSRAEDLRSHQKTHNYNSGNSQGREATSSSGLSANGLNASVALKSNSPVFASSNVDRSDRLGLSLAAAVASSVANSLTHTNFSALTDSVAVTMPMVNQVAPNGSILQSQLSKLQQLQVGPVNFTNLSTQGDDSMHQPVIILQENAASPSEPNPATGLHLPDNYF